MFHAILCAGDGHALGGSDDSDTEEGGAKRARGRPPGALLMFTMLYAHCQYLCIKLYFAGMPGMYKELAQKGREILLKCSDKLEDAEEPEQGRTLWMEMRQLQYRRNQEGGKPLGTAEDKKVYNMFHAHFMEDVRGHTSA